MGQGVLCFSFVQTDLNAAAQTSFTKKLQDFTFSRVTGATTDQLRAMAQVAQDVVMSP
jgi:hypothetical protein